MYACVANSTSVPVVAKASFNGAPAVDVTLPAHTVVAMVGIKVPIWVAFPGLIVTYQNGVGDIISRQARVLNIDATDVTGGQVDCAEGLVGYFIDLGDGQSGLGFVLSRATPPSPEQWSWYQQQELALANGTYLGVYPKGAQACDDAAGQLPGVTVVAKFPELNSFAFTAKDVPFGQLDALSCLSVYSPDQTVYPAPVIGVRN